jgi:NAD(P)-dependent dehydrogenase (short-subunit alcohol dehydrogenase family)
METNFWGTVRVVRAALPSLRAVGGRIVVLGSIGGVIGLPYQGYYSASKFALEGWGEALGYEVEPLGVRVTIVQPGNIKTDFTANRRMSPAPGTMPGLGGGEGPVAVDVAGGAGQVNAMDDVYGPYRDPMKKAIEVMERDERNGAPVADVAAVIVKALSAKRPPRKVSVGKASERVGVLGKKLLPFGLFQASAKSSLGV